MVGTAPVAGTARPRGSAVARPDRDPDPYEPGNAGSPPRPVPKRGSRRCEKRGHGRRAPPMLAATAPTRARTAGFRQSVVTRPSTAPTVATARKNRMILRGLAMASPFPSLSAGCTAGRAGDRPCGPMSTVASAGLAAHLLDCRHASPETHARGSGKGHRRARLEGRCWRCGCMPSGKAPSPSDWCPSR